MNVSTRPLWLAGPYGAGVPILSHISSISPACSGTGYDPPQPPGSKSNMALPPGVSLRTPTKRLVGAHQADSAWILTTPAVVAVIPTYAEPSV